MLSKYGSDSDDWCVDQNLYEYLERCWGPHDIDAFANMQNKKCKVFYSFLPSVSRNKCIGFSMDK